MNTRTLAIVSACLAMFASVVAANLWRELRAERQLTTALRSGAPGTFGHSPEPGWAPGSGSGAAWASASQGDSDPSPITVVAPPDDAAAMGQNTGQHDLRMHPQQREARLAELRSSIERSYPGLVEELELTLAESDQFFGMLAEGRVALEAEAHIFESEPVDLLAAAQASRNRQIRQRQQNQAVRTLLGNDRYARWHAYQQNQTAWMQAGAYGSALASSGAPLDGAQTRAIAVAMIEEQQRQKQDLAALARTVDLADPQTQVQARGALERRRQESGRRILDAAAPHLTAQQLRLLRDQIALHGDETHQRPKLE